MQPTVTTTTFVRIHCHPTLLYVLRGKDLSHPLSQQHCSHHGACLSWFCSSHYIDSESAHISLNSHFLRYHDISNHFKYRCIQSLFILSPFPPKLMGTSFFFPSFLLPSCVIKNFGIFKTFLSLSSLEYIPNGEKDDKP